MKTTNYHDGFIQVAEDCPIRVAEVPPWKGKSQTVVNSLFDLLAQSPCRYRSGDVVFDVYVVKNHVKRGDLARVR